MATTCSTAFPVNCLLFAAYLTWAACCWHDFLLHRLVFGLLACANFACLTLLFTLQECFFSKSFCTLSFPTFILLFLFFYLQKLFSLDSFTNSFSSSSFLFVWRTFASVSLQRVAFLWLKNSVRMLFLNKTFVVNQLYRFDSKLKRLSIFPFADPKNRQVTQRKYRSQMSDQICYAVLCVFSYVAAGLEHRKRHVINSNTNSQFLRVAGQSSRTSSTSSEHSSTLNTNRAPQQSATLQLLK